MKHIVLENKAGQVVRAFQWDAQRINVIYRQDTRRVETVGALKELTDQKIPYTLIAKTTPAALKRAPIDIPNTGRIRWVDGVTKFSQSVELPAEKTRDFRTYLKWSAIAQVTLVALVVAIGYFLSKELPSESTTFTVIPDEVVEKMKKEIPPSDNTPTPPRHKAKQESIAKNKKVVVAPSATKIDKRKPVPTRSTSTRKNARHKNTATAKVAKRVRGGGYKGAGRKGSGSGHARMNQMGALGALTKVARANGGNGGSKGVDLRAVGSSAGSGAGGRGFGGFGGSGGDGRKNGVGGLGSGRSSGLAQAMYGKGLIAAPSGDGSPAPGGGGYGTRGKAGGGAQGAGYGSVSIVGSNKGLGPKGSGAAGSGWGQGGSGAGYAGGDDDDMVVTGGLDADQIAEVIARYLGQITYCYEQGLQKNPALSGRVATKFEIAPHGRVNTARIAHSSVRSSIVENCIVGKVRSWKFPKPHGGVNVAVTYPFVLRRVSQR